MTTAQLDVLLVRREHPFIRRFREQWTWFTCFHNALATRVFERLDLQALQSIDELRRLWVGDWLQTHGLPNVPHGKLLR